MKKKITAMLLAICCISSTWTVYADDFPVVHRRLRLRSQKTQMQMMKCFLTGQKAVLPVGISVQWLIRS